MNYHNQRSGSAREMVRKARNAHKTLYKLCNIVRANGVGSRSPLLTGEGQWTWCDTQHENAAFEDALEKEQRRRQMHSE